MKTPYGTFWYAPYDKTKIKRALWLGIYYLPMGEWWWKLERAQSRMRLIAKTLVLILRESLKNTVNENVKCFPIHFEMDKYLISKKDCFERKGFAKNDLHTRSADDNAYVIEKI